MTSPELQSQATIEGGTLYVQDPRGNVETVEIVRAGGVIRVAVGGPGRRSAVWRIWANRGSSDVYMAARTMAHIQKFSLHQSGIWQYGFTSEFMKSPAGSSVEERITNRWQRPAPDPLVRAPSIRVRAEDVTPAQDPTSERGVTWIPAPPPGSGSSIQAVFLPRGQVLELVNSRPVGALALANGEALVVVSSTEILTTAALSHIERLREQAEALLPPEVLALRGTPGYRAGYIGRDAWGGRYLWDAAF